MSTNPAETYRRMAALAKDPGASEAEKATAADIMRRYEAKYGAENLIPAEEAVGKADVAFANVYEEDIATHCGRFMGVEVAYLGQYKYRGTKREKFVSNGKTLRFTGPETAVAAAVALYEHHLPILRRRLELARNAYCFAAMPIKTAGVNAREMTPDEAALLAAMRAAGARNSMGRALPSTSTPNR